MINQLDTEMLDRICHVYRAGAPNARNPHEFELVQCHDPQPQGGLGSKDSATYQRSISLLF